MPGSGSDAAILRYLRSLPGRQTVLVQVENGLLSRVTLPFGWFEPPGLVSFASSGPTERPMNLQATDGSREQPPLARRVAGAGTHAGAPSAFDPASAYIQRMDRGDNTGAFCMVCYKFAWDQEAHEMTSTHIERMADDPAWWVRHNQSRMRGSSERLPDKNS